jgi:hypothetical protein
MYRFGPAMFEQMDEEAAAMTTRRSEVAYI